LTSVTKIKDIGPVLWRQDGVRTARVSKQLAPASAAQMQKCGGQAEKPLDTLGCRVIQLRTLTERHTEACGYCWPAYKGLQFSKSSDGGWSKLLNHRGSTLAFFTPFPCASLRYVADCLVCGPRLLCIPWLAHRAVLSAENSGDSESTGKWCAVESFIKLGAN